MKIVFLLCFVMSSMAIEREVQLRIVDYLKILNQSPVNSAMPEAICKQLLTLKTEEEKKIAAQGLYKECVARGIQIIYLCRKESEAVIKQSSLAKVELIKEKLSFLRGIGELTDANIKSFSDGIKELEEIFVPKVEWSEDIKQAKKCYELLSKSVKELDGELAPVDFAALEYIAKVSVCPLLVNDKSITTNFTEMGKFPLEATLAAAQINLMRVFAGKNTLIIDDKLNALSLSHCKDMKTNNYFGGESPTAGMKTLQDRASKFGTTAEGEIFGRGTSDILHLNRVYFSRVKQSSLYFKNWTRLGVGYYDKHWTEVFGK